jgi:hypothetical protein
MPIARHCLSLAAVAVLTGGLSGSLAGDGALAEASLGSANRILAVYRVEVAGFNLGDFRLTTVFRGADYEMRGEARFSILEGLLYDWRGNTASTGKVTDTGPQPTMYALNFRGGGDKSGQLRISFESGAVTGVQQIPRKRPNPHVIPITKEQLEGVLDPMTAAFLYARSDNPNGDPKVCDQTIPVFDGEARFNLVLRPKRTVKMQKDASTGYSGFAAVCGVKFVPISGYRPDNPGIKLMSESNEIEVWLVSLPGTPMYVPYKIVLPTLVGYGSATSTSFQVNRGARRAGIDPESQR